MMSYVPRLKQYYDTVVVPKLVEQFGYKTNMEVPRLVKVSLNQGIGQATQDKKLIDVYQQELSTIAGQKAVPTIARTSISNFKLREGISRILGGGGTSACDSSCWAMSVAWR